MNCALYEWGWILFMTIAASCGTYWCISLISDKASFALFLANDDFVQVGDGEVIWTDWLNTPTRIKEFDQGQYMMWSNPPVDVHVAFPCVTYRKLTWTNPLGTWNQWMLRVSLLLPTLASTLLAALCVWRYRQLRLSAVGQAASPATSSGTPGRP